MLPSMPARFFPPTAIVHFVNPGVDGAEHMRISRNGVDKNSTSAPPV
jgi:hypothetical protein